MSFGDPHKVVHMLPPDLCCESLPTVNFYHGPLDDPSLRHSDCCCLWCLPSTSKPVPRDQHPPNTYRWFRWPIRRRLVSNEPNNPSLPLWTFPLGVRTKRADWSLLRNSLTFVCCSDQQHPSGPARLLHCSCPTRLKRTIFDNRWGWDLCPSQTTLFQGQQILTGSKWWLKT